MEHVSLVSVSDSHISCWG